MDISQLSTVMAMQDLGIQVNMAAMKLGKEMIQQNGEQLVASIKDMEYSIKPHNGNNIDIAI